MGRHSTKAKIQPRFRTDSFSPLPQPFFHPPRNDSGDCGELIINTLIAIRCAIEDRASSLVRRAWIIERDDALALADKHALSHDHRRFVADDDARMRRGQARSLAVGPEARVTP